jgi:LAO/AO transport system kinase
VLDAAGFDVVLVETVGVGQAEVEVASLADSTLVLLAPGMGDAIQAAKAGILEVADVFVVNKADRDGADQTYRELKQMLQLGSSNVTSGGWKPPVVKTVAARQEGVDDVVDALERHHEWMERSGELTRRRHARACGEIEAIAVTAIRERMGDLRGGTEMERLAALVTQGELDPYAAADRLVEGVTA